MWLFAFFSRHGCTLRKIGKRMNKIGLTGDLTGKVQEFHLRTRVFQLYEIRDFVYGYGSQDYVYTYDQVHIVLCNSYVKTVKNKGAIEVYDATAKERDIKCFCTLNLAGHLKRKDSGSNVPPPYLVFQSSGFKSSDDWNQAEVTEYHPVVVVSFQRRAWVDTRTHIHGLT